MKIFCERLKETRGDTSQKVFAASLGLNQQTYQRYESGVREPDLETLRQIGVSCGVSLNWLLGLPEHASSSTAIANGGVAITGSGNKIRGTIVTRDNGHDKCSECKYKRLADAFKAL